ncbi:MAG: DUF3617 family protein [Sphingomonas sp.]
MRTWVLITVPLILAGCSKSIDLHDATIDQFTAAAKEVRLQKPGRWTVESRVTAMDLGTTDAAMAPMIRDQAMQPHTVSICVKKDQPNMMSVDQMQALKTMACRIPHFTAKKGAIDGEIACTAPNGTMTMNEQGTYTDETYDMHLAIKQATQGQPTISTETQVKARRVGDCEN